jgi:hypothetical protein
MGDSPELQSDFIDEETQEPIPPVDDFDRDPSPKNTDENLTDEEKPESKELNDDGLQLIEEQLGGTGWKKFENNTEYNFKEYYDPEEKQTYTINQVTGEKEYTADTAQDLIGYNEMLQNLEATQEHIQESINIDQKMVYGIIVRLETDNTISNEIYVRELTEQETLESKKNKVVEDQSDGAEQISFSETSADTKNDNSFPAIKIDLNTIFATSLSTNTLGSTGAKNTSFEKRTENFFGPTLSFFKQPEIATERMEDVSNFTILHSQIRTEINPSPIQTGEIINIKPADPLEQVIASSEAAINFSTATAEKSLHGNSIETGISLRFSNEEISGTVRASHPETFSPFLETPTLDKATNEFTVFHEPGAVLTDDAFTAPTALYNRAAETRPNDHTTELDFVGISLESSKTEITIPEINLGVSFAQAELLQPESPTLQDTFSNLEVGRAPEEQSLEVSNTPHFENISHVIPPTKQITKVIEANRGQSFTETTSITTPLPEIAPPTELSTVPEITHIEAAIPVMAAEDKSFMVVKDVAKVPVITQGTEQASIVNDDVKAEQASTINEVMNSINFDILIPAAELSPVILGIDKSLTTTKEILYLNKEKNSTFLPFKGKKVDNKIRTEKKASNIVILRPGTPIKIRSVVGIQKSSERKDPTTKPTEVKIDAQDPVQQPTLRATPIRPIPVKIQEVQFSRESNTPTKTVIPINQSLRPTQTRLKQEQLKELNNLQVDQINKEKLSLVSSNSSEKVRSQAIPSRSSGSPAKPILRSSPTAESRPILNPIESGSRRANTGQIAVPVSTTQEEPIEKNYQPAYNAAA